MKLLAVARPRPFAQGRLLRLRSGQAQSALCLLGEALKSGWIFDCQIGKDFAVQSDAGFLEAVDERAVAHAVQLGGGADAHDPQRPVLTLALVATAVGALQPAPNGFFGRAVEFGFCQEITAGAVQYLFTFRATFRPAFYTRHGVAPFRLRFKGGWR